MIDERDDELRGREREQAEDIAVHRTEPDQAADEGYPIGEIEEGDERQAEDERKEKQGRRSGVALDDHEA